MSKAVSFGTTSAKVKTHAHNGEVVLKHSRISRLHRYWTFENRAGQRKVPRRLKAGWVLFDVGTGKSKARTLLANYAPDMMSRRARTSFLSYPMTSCSIRRVFVPVRMCHEYLPFPSCELTYFQTRNLIRKFALTSLGLLTTPLPQFPCRTQLH